MSLQSCFLGYLVPVTYTPCCYGRSFICGGVVYLDDGIVAVRGKERAIRESTLVKSDLVLFLV